MNIIQLIISLSILVFIHELGHFAMARLFGTRVEKFYLFFNPWFSLFKYKSKRSGTVYGLGWLPLGGYCQIAGMVDEAMDSESLKSEPKPDEFRSKKAWQRLLIMAGGVIFNLILAMLLYISIAFAWGDKHLDSRDVEAGWAFSPVAQEMGFQDGDIILSVDGQTELNALSPRLLSDVIEAKRILVLRGNVDTIAIDMPADAMQRLIASGNGFAAVRTPFVIEEVINEQAKARGLQAGQRICTINGTPTPSIEQVREELAKYSGSEVAVTTESEGATMEYRVPVDTLGHIGIVARPLDEVYKVRQIDYNLLTAIPAGINRAVSTIDSYVGSLKYVFTKEGAKSMGGLGTMARLFPQGFSWASFWSVTAFLSIILAVMNLLPIPALDGGHILFILIEMITRRKLSDKVMMYIQTAGMILLLLLMLYANGNDLYRYLIK